MKEFEKVFRLVKRIKHRCCSSVNSKFALCDYNNPCIHHATPTCRENKRSVTRELICSISTLDRIRRVLEVAAR